MQRRLIIFLLLALTIGLGYVLLRHHMSLERLSEQEQYLRQVVQTYPVTSFFVGFLVYAVASLVPGTAGKAIVFGWLFGFWLGLLLVNGGLTVAAVIAFFAIRYLFHDEVHRRAGKIVRRIDEALLEEGPVYLLTLRLLHAPYTLTNYAAGATDVPARTFWWTTHLGMLPGNIVLVLAGSRLPSLETVTERGIWTLLNFPLLVVLTLAGLVPVAIRWLVSRWRARKGRPPDEQLWDHGPSDRSPRETNA